MEGLRIKKQAIIMLSVLILFFCISYASAQDLNDTSQELDLDPNDLQSEITAPSNDSESFDETVLGAESSNDAISKSNFKFDNGTDDRNILTSKPSSTADSKAHLVLDNDADTENIYIGDYVTWIVSVINEGPDTARNVNVFDQLPDGLEYVKHVAGKGIFNPLTGIWNIGDLAISDGEVFLNITTKAITAGEKINKANLTSDTYNSNHNESYEEEEIDVFEHEKEKENVFQEQSIDLKDSTGNPIALIVFSMLAILITIIRSKK